MKFSVHLVKKEDFGESRFENVAYAHDPEPGETVEDLVRRLFGPSVFDRAEIDYAARIEIRLKKEG